MLLTTFTDQTAEDHAVLQKAARFFREQKRRLHNHPTHDRSKFGSYAYLDALAINKEPSHDVARHYLDTLSDANTKICSWAEYNHQLAKSRARQVMKDEVGDKLQIMKNLLTWDDYKHLASELQDRKHEVNGRFLLPILFSTFHPAFLTPHVIIFSS